MSEELLNIAKELSEKPMTELALQFMELTADNIIKEKEINRLNNIINELEKDIEKKIYDIKNNYSQVNGNYFNMNYVIDTYEDVLDKLKELKEDNNV